MECTRTYCRKAAILKLQKNLSFGKDIKINQIAEKVN